MNPDKYLITQDDIKRYRPTAELDEARFLPFVLEAQYNDLRPVLNNAFYFDFISKFDVEADVMYTKYKDLLAGKQWTYNSNPEYFNGIRPMLCYFALARFVEMNPFHITRHGITKKIVAQSEQLTEAEIRIMVNSLKSTAISYQNDVIRFLENNPTDYPLYNTGGASENAAHRTSFNFFRV
jgi:hypothetical protein